MTAQMGHNSTSGEAQDRLRSFIQRIERLEEDRDAVKNDIGEVYAEIKGVGLDAKIVRRIIRERKIEIEKSREEEELLSLYKAAIGMED